MLQEYIMSKFEESADRIAIRLRSELKLVVPRDTSRLGQSIDVIYSNNKLIISAADYLLHIEYGTRPHVIRPKNKKALAFKSGGKEIVVKVVHHPGTRANPFIRETIFTKLKDIIIEELNR